MNEAKQWERERKHTQTSCNAYLIPRHIQHCAFYQTKVALNFKFKINSVVCISSKLINRLICKWKGTCLRLNRSCKRYYCLCSRKVPSSAFIIICRIMVMSTNRRKKLYDASKFFIAYDWRFWFVVFLNWKQENQAKTNLWCF